MARKDHSDPYTPTPGQTPPAAPSDPQVIRQPTQRPGLDPQTPPLGVPVAPVAPVAPVQTPAPAVAPPIRDPQPPAPAAPVAGQTSPVAATPGTTDTSIVH